MNTKAKSNSVITHRIEANAIIFTVLGVGDIHFNYIETVDSGNREQAEQHGWIQRISDAAAISRNPETGKPATPQEKFDAMAKLVAHYESGTSEWSRVREGEGNSGGLLFRALCKMSPSKSPDDIRTWMKGQTKSKLGQLARSDKVAAVINEIRPVNVEIDADEMLAEIGIE